MGNHEKHKSGRLSLFTWTPKYHAIIVTVANNFTMNLSKLNRAVRNNMHQNISKIVDIFNNCSL